MGNQRCDAELLLDVECVKTLGKSLKNLILRGNRMTEIRALGELKELRVLDLTDNSITFVSELEYILEGKLDSIEQLQIIGNPVISSDSNWRDAIISCSSRTLVQLNDKDIGKTERDYCQKKRGSQQKILNNDRYKNLKEDRKLQDSLEEEK